MGVLSLSQPPPDRPWLHRAISVDDPLPEPGQAYRACLTRHHDHVVICHPVNRSGIDTFQLNPDVCWTHVRRCKGRVPEYLNAKQWRTDNVPTGYRNHARFEAACHIWICRAPEGYRCSCTDEYEDWIAEQCFTWTILAEWATADPLGAAVP
jgi:hypothetical protein